MSLFTKNHWMCLWACVVGAVLSGSSTSGDERASSTRAELFSERGHVARRVVSAGSADCGDGECSTELDENCATCESDCGVCPCDNATTGNCGSGQIGINGGRGECNLDDCWDRNKNGTCDFVDEDLNGDSVCDLQDCFWTGLAFPIETGGAAIDTLRFQLNTNRAGGDIYITGDAGCQPDVKNMLVRMCCGATGQPSGPSGRAPFRSRRDLRHGAHLGGVRGQAGVGRAGQPRFLQRHDLPCAPGGPQHQR